jgi:hypothetical protein
MASEKIEQIMGWISGYSPAIKENALRLLLAIEAVDSRAFPDILRCDGLPVQFVWESGEMELSFAIEPLLTDEQMELVISRVLLDKGLIPPMEESLMEECELDGGSYMPLDYLEELRLTLKSFMTPPVLESINNLCRILNAKPVSSEAYSGLSRRSEHGFQCKYALAHLDRFKREKLDKTIALLEECLLKMKELKSERSD